MRHKIIKSPVKFIVVTNSMSWTEVEYYRSEFFATIEVARFWRLLDLPTDRTAETFIQTNYRRTWIIEHRTLRLYIIVSDLRKRIKNVFDDSYLIIYLYPLRFRQGDWWNLLNTDLFYSHRNRLSRMYANEQDMLNREKEREYNWEQRNPRVDHSIWRIKCRWLISVCVSFFLEPDTISMD